MHRGANHWLPNRDEFTKKVKCFLKNLILIYLFFSAKRRKTWSGDQFAEAMKIHQNNESLQSDLSPDRQDMYV